MGRRRKEKGCVENLVDGTCDLVGGLVGGAIALVGAFVPYGEEEDNHVEYGSDFWGHRYKKTSGICYRCHGKGYVHEETCPKCGGSGRYERTTWYD